MNKLSIITINYNDRSGLEKTIESVINQTYKNFQYVVIDGGSTDGSKEVLDLYRDRLDVAISEKDSGIYNAMNKGASYANGEYMLFLNSGDVLYDSTTFEKLNIESFRDDIVCGRILIYSEKDNFITYPPEHISLFTFIGGSLPHPSSFIKRNLFEKIGGYKEEYRIISDWCFFVEALLIHRCSYLTITNVVSKFNRFGISSTMGYTEEDMKKDFLISLFGNIVNDYIPVKDEALSNCMYWISAQSDIWGELLRLPFKVLNRVLKLRNRLKRRIGMDLVN